MVYQNFNFKDRIITEDITGYEINELVQCQSATLIIQYILHALKCSIL